MIYFTHKELLVKIFLVIISLFVPKILFGQTGFSQLENELQIYLKEKKTACIGTIIKHKDEIVFETYLGVKNLETGDKINGETLFRLASLTKPIISVAILKLIDQNKISIEDKVVDYLPQFNSAKYYQHNGGNSTEILIKHLLTHTSGISSPLMGDEQSKLYLKLHEDNGNSLKNLVDGISQIPLAHKVDERFSYGYSTDVLARIIELISFMPLDEFLAEEIFVPLGMNDTFYRVPQNRKSDFASLYEQNNDSLKLVELNSESLYMSERNYPRGSTGMISTVKDYLKFAQFILKKGKIGDTQLISQNLMEKLFKNQLPTKLVPLKVGSVEWAGLGFSYGFSVSYEENAMGKVPGTIGWIGASHTYFFIDPTNELIGIAFSQFQGFGKFTLPWEFNKMVYDALGF